MKISSSSSQGADGLVGCFRNSPSVAVVAAGIRRAGYSAPHQCAIERGGVCGGFLLATSMG